MEKISMVTVVGGMSRRGMNRVVGNQITHEPQQALFGQLAILKKIKLVKTGITCSSFVFFIITFSISLVVLQLQSFDQFLMK
jgi:hypothetical protein